MHFHKEMQMSHKSLLHWSDMPLHHYGPKLLFYVLWQILIDFSILAMILELKNFSYIYKEPELNEDVKMKPFFMISLEHRAKNCGHNLQLPHSSISRAKVSQGRIQRNGPASIHHGLSSTYHYFYHHALDL